MRRDYMNEKPPNTMVDSIIRNHVVWSMGAGFIPLPVIDIFAMSAVQLDMVRQMSQLYQVDFDGMQGKSLITAMVGSSMARIGASAVKLIPGFGQVIGGIALPILSGASTYALGQVFKQHFETGGTFLDFDVDRLRKYYTEQFEKGKKVAEDIKREEGEKKTEAEASNGEETPKKKKTTRRRKASTEATPEPVAEAVNDEPNTMDAALKKLQDLAKLRDDKVITEAEFQKMKQKMMNKF